MLQKRTSPFISFLQGLILKLRRSSTLKFAKVSRKCLTLKFANFSCHEFFLSFSGSNLSKGREICINVHESCASAQYLAGFHDFGVVGLFCTIFGLSREVGGLFWAIFSLSRGTGGLFWAIFGLSRGVGGLFGALFLPSRGLEACFRPF